MTTIASTLTAKVEEQANPRKARVHVQTLSASRIGIKDGWEISEGWRDGWEPYRNCQEVEKEMVGPTRL